MLDNQITLATDKANNATIVNEVFFRYDESSPNRVTYRGPAFTLVTKDTMKLYRTPVNPNGNFLGTAKSEIKFSKNFTVIGKDGSTISAPGIAGANFSFPVGMTTEDMTWMRQRLIAAIDHSFAGALTETLEI